MKHIGRCHCENSQVVVETNFDFQRLSPRICDCDSCQSLDLPVAMVSDPSLSISVNQNLEELELRKNGSNQASFFHCKGCGQLLAVGADIHGELRGAVNAFLFKNLHFADAIPIQPRLLSSSEKQARWDAIWGRLNV